MDHRFSEQTALMPLKDTILEIYQQPEVVAEALRNNHASVLELATKIVKLKINNCHIVGSGDSMSVGQCVQQAFTEYSGLSLSAIQAYEFAVFGNTDFQGNSAFFMISSSGRQSTTRDALDRALKSSALVIGVTDKEDDSNPFLSKPDHALVPGGVKNGWPTQTTTATIAVLMDLSIQIGKISGILSAAKADKLHQQLLEMPALMEKTLVENGEIMRQIAGKFIDTRSIYFIGSGPGYGVANIGGALMAEGPQKIGVPFYVEEFHHSLRINTVDMGMPVFLIAPKDPAYLRYKDTAKLVKNWGGYLVAISGENDHEVANYANAFVKLPVVPYSMHPLLSVLPLHLFSIELTHMLINKGYQLPWYSV